MIRIYTPQDRTELDNPTRQFSHDTFLSSGLIRLIEILPGGWEDDL